MSDRDFQIGGRNFKLCKIDAFKQFHIVRRVGPMLSDLLPAMKGMSGKNLESLPEDEKLDAISKFVAPIMNGLSKLPDADADLVLFGLLAAVEAQQTTGNWIRISTGSMLMVQDLELPIMLQLAGRAFMYNLSGFFGALPQKI